MYEKSTFAKGTAASLGVVALIGLIVMASGTAYAMPLAGVGDFKVKANQVTAQQVVIYPGVSDTSNQAAYPMAVVEQKGVTIKGMQLIKTLDVGSIPGLSGKMRMVISASKPVHADKQVLKFSNLQAKSASFNGQIIDEHNSNDPTKQFDIGAGSYHGRTININKSGPAQNLKGVTINAHYLASNQITLPGMQFSVQYDPSGNGNYHTLMGGSPGNGGNASNGTAGGNGTQTGS